MLLNSGTRCATPRPRRVVHRVRHTRAAALRLAVVAAIALPVSRRAAGQTDGLGLEVLAPQNTYPLALPFLHFGGMTGAQPAPGELWVRAEGIYSNTFSHSYHADAIKLELGTRGLPFTLAEAEIEHQRHYYQAIFFIQAEVLRTALTAELGLFREVSVSLEVPYISFSAISADSAIMAFHRAFGISQAQRNDFPRDRFEIVLQPVYGPLIFDDQRPTAGLGDIVSTAKWRHPFGEVTSLWADLSLKLPTGSAEDFRGSGSADVGAMFGLTARSGPESWSLQGGAVIPGRWRGPLGLDAAPFGRALAGTTRLLGRHRAISLSVTLEDSPLRRYHLAAVSQPAVQVVLGGVRSLGSWGALDLTISEHIPRFGDGTDVAIRLGVTVNRLP